MSRVSRQCNGVGCAWLIPATVIVLRGVKCNENLKEKKVDSAGLEPATLGLYPIALPIELRAQLVRLSCRHSTPFSFKGQREA